MEGTDESTELRILTCLLWSSSESILSTVFELQSFAIIRPSYFVLKNLFPSLGLEHRIDLK